MYQISLCCGHVNVECFQTAESGEGSKQVHGFPGQGSLATEQSVCTGQGTRRVGQSPGEKGMWLLAELAWKALS